METSLGVWGAIPHQTVLVRVARDGGDGQMLQSRAEPPLHPPKQVTGGPNWSNASPNWLTEQPKLEWRGLVGKELMDISGLSATQPDNTQKHAH